MPSLDEVSEDLPPDIEEVPGGIGGGYEKPTGLARSMMARRKLEPDTVDTFGDVTVPGSLQIEEHNTLFIVYGSLTTETLTNYGAVGIYTGGLSASVINHGVFGIGGVNGNDGSIGGDVINHGVFAVDFGDGDIFGNFTNEGLGQLLLTTIRGTGGPFYLSMRLLANNSTAWDGVYVDHGRISTTTIQNGVDSFIRLGDAGVLEVRNLTNAGTITLHSTSFFVGWNGDGSGAGVNIINTGLIDGDVHFGNTNDSYNGAGGLLSDRLYGADGNDHLTGGNGMEVFFGEAGDDTLIGGGDRDTLDGGAGTNNLQGGDGNDVLFGGLGLNTLAGGAGDDYYVIGANTANTLIENANEGSDTLRIEFQNYVLPANFENLSFNHDGPVNGTGNELNNVIESTNANDILRGLGGNDTFHIYLGHDYVEGGDGDDVIMQVGNEDPNGDINNTDDVIDGGAGIDTLDFSGATGAITMIGRLSGGWITFGAGGLDAITSIENILGSSFNDTINGSDVSNSIYGGDGNDTIRGWGSTDDLRGGDGADWLRGDDGNDTVDGGAGADTLDGGLGFDTVQGGAGNDTIVYAMGDGNGVIDGGSDSDTLTLSDGASSSILSASFNGSALTALAGNSLTSIETINVGMGGGTDWLTYAAASAAVTVNLAIGAASGFTTITGVERVVGGNGADTLTGDAVDNRLDGGAGDDVLSGAGGVDTLIGGDGADVISGGLANDSIQGGAGADTISWALGDGRDTIDGGADADAFYAAGSAAVELGNVSWNGSAITALMDNALTSIEAVNLDLGGGVDWLIYNATASVVVNLATNSASGFASVSNIEKVIGGSVNDTLTGDNLDNRLDGLAGNDTLDGGAGSDAVLGGDGDDTLYASAGNDSLQGQNGNDTFIWTSTDGRDTFNGGADPDTVNLTGSAVADVADTNWNGTSITGILNNALVSIENVNLDLGAGGAGGDWLRYNTTSGISVDLGAGTATGFASITGVENLIGGTGNDSLTGDGGVNKINGNNGDDVITGGAGNDNLTGGLGNDVFVYAAGAGNDTINDFDAWDVGGQDFLDVSAFGINAGNFAARVAIIDTGADTVIRIDDTYFITLKNVSGDGDNSITQADFIFGP